MRTEYYNNILCIEAGWLIDSGILSESNYRQQCLRGKLNVLRRACKGTPALVEWSTLPQRFKAPIINQYGDPEKVTPQSHFENYIMPDNNALEYFSRFRLPDGRALEHAKITEYYNNAIILNAIQHLLTNRAAMRKAIGGTTRGLWLNISNTVNSLDRIKYPHSLPGAERRLREDRYNKYVADGYFALIHKGYCHNNSRKVTADLERLMLSLYCASNNPYAKTVHDDYLRFIAGDIDVVDMETGEMFNRADFYNEKTDAPIIISEATCWNYINNPKNRAIVDAVRMSPHKYRGLVRPHNHRSSPVWGLSKISLDDRDLPRKLHNGNRVKAYYAYDVASGVLLGASYSFKKDTSLFINCVQNMFRFINGSNWGMPMEVEVEHHLVSNFKNDLMQAGVVFPFVRWCAPTNSQEKRAEQFNKAKKYGYEKRYQDGIGRFYAKLEANQTGGERVFDEIQQKYIIKEQTYNYDRLVADDLKSIERYNNGLHRNQKLYKGKTRMQVLTENINPNLAKIDHALLARYIGTHTQTTIRRNQYCRVQYANYTLPSPQITAHLEPNNYNVDAYWLQAENGEINEVYLYQNNKFLCKADKITAYNEAIAERTDDDYKAKAKQDEYNTQFDRMVASGKTWLAKPQIIENNINYSDIKVVTVAETVPAEIPFDFGFDINPEYQKEAAIDSL